METLSSTLGNCLKFELNSESKSTLYKSLLQGDFPLFFIQQAEKKTDCHLVISDYMKLLPRLLHEGGEKCRHKLSSSEDRQLLLS